MFCVLSFYEVIECNGFLVALDIKEEKKIFANIQLFKLLVSNLVENAIRFSTTPELLIKENKVS